MTTLLLVDNDPQILAGLEMLFALEPDLEVCGTATSAGAAIELARRMQPDIIVMDVRLPDTDGITATASLLTALPGSRIIILSLYADAATRLRAEQAGAHAFVAKHDMSGALLAAIRRMASQEDPVPAPPDS